MTLDYMAIDVDNHYYEPINSCTRHLPKEFKRHAQGRWRVHESIGS